MSKHSPGPWRACGQDGSRVCVCGLVWSVPTDTPVADLRFKNEEEDVTYDVDMVTANARLIAAAPEMLELLKEMLNSDALRNESEEFHGHVATFIRRIEG